MKTVSIPETFCYYDFGDFRIDTARRRLLRGDDVVHLPPKVFDTLLILVHNHGRVIDKNEIIEHVWYDTIVEENNLTQNISAIRKALGDHRSRNNYVLTIPGRGYQFVADVREVDGAPKHNGKDLIKLERVSDHPAVEGGPQSVARSNDFSGSGFRAIVKRPVFALTLVLICLTAITVLQFTYGAQPGAERLVTKTVAVLPFKSLGTEGPEEYIGTGMADALITRLSEIRQIAVRPTSAVLPAAHLPNDALAAGRWLGVDLVIDGHIQKVGERLRLTVQVIQTSDGATVSAMQFDGDITDIFAMQDSLSEQAATALQVRLSGDERRQMARRYTENPDAYMAFTKATYLMREPTDEKVKKSIEYYQQALTLDPNYALAYAGLADSYMRLHGRGVTTENAKCLDLARDAVTRALQIDDTVAYAHSILGFIAFRYDWDFPLAEREYKRARELDPNYVNSWFGFYLITENRFAEAEEEFKRYQESRPLEPEDIVLYHFFLRKYDLAEKEIRDHLDIDSNNGSLLNTLSLIYEQKGMYDEAFAALQKRRELSGDQKPDKSFIAHLYAVSGSTQEARTILDNMQTRTMPEFFWANYLKAVVCAGLGEKDEAIGYLEEAHGEHSLGPAWLRFDPRLDGLRSEPRFQQLLTRAGLTSQN